MNTLKTVEQKIQRPGMLVAKMADDWGATDFRPKENEILQTLLAHNQQTHVFDQLQIRNDNHAIYYFDRDDSELVLDKIAKNRKLKLKDFLLTCLAKAAKKLEIEQTILHLDMQKPFELENLEKSSIVAYDLGKIHRRKLESKVQLTMIPPLFDQKISVSFIIFAGKLSLAVNGDSEIKDVLLEMWIREINNELFN